MADSVDNRPLVFATEQTAFYRSLVAQHGSPLLAFYPQRLVENFEQLQQALPEVELFYAVKAHPDAEIIRTLAELGAGFDVASAGEMDLLLEQSVSGRRTIHTHPVKKDKEIRDALRFGATTFVVDNLYELKKLVPYKNRVGVLLRVSFRSENAKVDLSKKFGCAEEEVISIVEQANEWGIHIKGLSFHVGSQCANADKHVEAILACKELIVELNQRVKRPLSTIDIGGGFPADYELQGIDIDAFCAPIRAVLASLPSDWHILAEPGRYLVASTVESITTVTGKSVRGGRYWYYLDDGVYGSYSGQIFDHVAYPLSLIATEGEFFASVLAGPTCDSIDIIAENISLPELQIDDLVIGKQMGAYTAATKTRFNSIPDAKFIVVK